jgi:hypothetical protein
VRDGSLEYYSSHWDVDKPNPSNEAIVLVDDDPVHTICKIPSPPGAKICIGASPSG